MPGRYPGDYTSEEFLRHVMKETGFSIEQLAMESGVQPSIIKRLLSGNMRLLPKHTEEIFKVLGLRVLIVIEEEEDDDELHLDEEGDWSS